jgi:hypothetical protein
MAEDVKHDPRPVEQTRALYRLCRHNYAGTLHLTNFWWSDSKDDVLGTGALVESVWLDPQGRARLRVDLGMQRVRMQVLSSDARACLTPLTAYHLEDRVGQVIFTRQIDDEIGREVGAMSAATRGMGVADAWLAVLDKFDLRSAWIAEMTNRGLGSDDNLGSTYHANMPARLVQQAHRTWAAAYEGAQRRHASLLEELQSLTDGDKEEFGD